jgi:SAM-dependent methyltransferase
VTTPVVDGHGVAWRAEVRPCPVCDSGRYATLGRRGGAAHRAGLGVETSVVRCRGCHAVYPRPFLLPETNPYHSYAADEYFAAHGLQEKVERGRSLARTAAAIRGGTGLLLEIGCGRGELLVGARQEGWSVRGVEMTPEFATHVRDQGIEVEAAPVETCRSLDARYDAIFLAAIVEHLYTPRQTILRCAEALLPGGVLFIDTPNECGPWARFGNFYQRLRRRRWAVNLSPTFPPFHVVGFCPASLRHLLRSCGLEAAKLSPYPMKNQVPARPGLLGRVEQAGANAVLSMGPWFGTGDGILCWARKP